MIDDLTKWIEVDCGCCAGIAWGGETPEECYDCGGRGYLLVHRKTGRIADYPGGPFRGQLGSEDLRRAIESSAVEDEEVTL